MQNQRSKPNKNTNYLLIIDRTSLLTRLPQEWGLNSRGLNRICSDSSSWTFGIEGENSMKLRDEIVILMLQWLRLYTGGSRGSRELKNFLKTRLISSRFDQKLRTKREEYTGFKEEIGPKIVGHWSGHGGDCKGRGSGSTWRGRGFNSTMILTEFSSGFSPNFTSKAPQLGHNQAMIGGRSWSWVSVDRRRIK